jgi:WD40 repeat protein
MEILQLGNKDNSTISGHNNRVFCCKFSKEDPNIILSGGWDEKVLIWDIRE